MKTLLIVLSLTASALIAQAQTVTNLAVRFQVERGTVGGTTNTTTTNVRYDYGNAKDLLKLNGLVFAYNQYRSSGATNDFNTWLKNDYSDRAKDYADVKQKADYSALLVKLQYALFTDPSLLDPTNFTALNVIAAKVP